MFGGYLLKDWAAAIIVMIIASVLPHSAAFAHPGHIGAPHAMDSAAPAHAAFHAADHKASQFVESGQLAESDQRPMRLQVPAAEAPVQSADRAPRKSDPHAACTESCCLLSGASCCGAAIASGVPGFSAGFAASQRFLPPQDFLLSGLSAQTLQKPPRVQL